VWGDTAIGGVRSSLTKSARTLGTECSIRYWLNKSPKSEVDIPGNAPLKRLPTGRSHRKAAPRAERCQLGSQIR